MDGQREMLPQIGTRQQWLAARLDLLAAEKQLTRQSDALARQRQALPWVPVEQAYSFETETGHATLADLFQGRSQLLVYHFMFGADYAAGCPSCSMIADGFNGFVEHLAQHDVSLWAVSRAPLSRLLDFRQHMGWSFPWASSAPSDFNADFNVYFTAEQQQSGAVDYNFQRAGHAMDALPPPVLEIAAGCGTDGATFTQDRPGMSAFVLRDGAVYHTYSAYARGLDALWGAYQWLDRAPLGRNETGIWWRRRGDYATAPSQSQPAACCA